MRKSRMIMKHQSAARAREGEADDVNLLERAGIWHWHWHVLVELGADLVLSEHNVPAPCQAPVAEDTKQIILIGLNSYQRHSKALSLGLIR